MKFSLQSFKIQILRMASTAGRNSVFPEERVDLQQKGILPPPKTQVFGKHKAQHNSISISIVSFIHCFNQEAVSPFLWAEHWAQHRPKAEHGASALVTTRTGKTSKELQQSRHQQGAQHSPNVPPKGSTALLTSPPSAVMIHRGQDSASKYHFLLLFSLPERLCKTLLFPRCLI